MSCYDKKKMWRDNSQIVQAVGLTSPTFDPVTGLVNGSQPVADGVVFATLQDGEGNPVIGCVHIALLPVGSPHNGNYAGQVNTDFNPTPGGDYVLVIDASEGTNGGHWEIAIEIEDREQPDAPISIDTQL
jgi:hypothetical protein